MKSIVSSAGLPDLSPEDLAVVPVERAATIPSSWYVHPGFLELEHEVVFGATWQCVGHHSQVSGPGDLITATIARNPIIVIRGKDGVLRAFHNVCRHRGGPLATRNGNSPHVLQCHYHGWTYLHDGSLRGVPDFDRVELFNKKDFGLIPVAVDVWQGLVFVNLSPSPEPLASSFRDIAERIAPTRLDEMHFYRRVPYEVRCNWKVYVDNYLEGYHVPIVHPELAKMLDYSRYFTEVAGTHSLQWSPLKPEENIYSRGEGTAYYYYIFPNLMLNILPGRLQTNAVLPVTHDRTVVLFDYYYADISSPAALAIIKEDIAFADRVQHEDHEICEQVQLGLQSMAYRQGRFSVKREECVYHFQTMLKRAFAGTRRGHGGDAVPGEEKTRPFLG